MTTNEKRRVDAFRSVAFSVYHEDLTDEQVEKTTAFQLWAFGEALAAAGRSFFDVFRPLLDSAARFVSRVLSGDTT